MLIGALVAYQGQDREIIGSLLKEHYIRYLGRELFPLLFSSQFLSSIEDSSPRATGFPFKNHR